MSLAPKRPPGRSTRKARAFEAEIRLLRAQGYTFEAIREALAEAGVHVSKSTVQREMARHAPVQPAQAADGVATVGGVPAAPPRAPMVIEPPPALASTPNRTERRSGKDIAEAFVRNRNTNPLIRSKEQT